MEKILIIDDDEDIAELESYILKKEGYETVIKNTGGSVSTDTNGRLPLVIERKEKNVRIAQIKKCLKDIMIWQHYILKLL